MKKYVIIFFCVLALACIILMIWDNAQIPFNPDTEHGGNLQGAIYYYPVFVLAELFAVILTINFFVNSSSLILNLLACIAWIALIVTAFLNSIHGDGTPAAHAFWLALVSILSVVLFILKLIKPDILR